MGAGARKVGTFCLCVVFLCFLLSELFGLFFIVFGICYLLDGFCCLKCAFDSLNVPFKLFLDCFKVLFKIILRFLYLLSL